MYLIYIYISIKIGLVKQLFPLKTYCFINHIYQIGIQIYFFTKVNIMPSIKALVIYFKTHFYRIKENINQVLRYSQLCENFQVQTYGEKKFNADFLEIFKKPILFSFFDQLTSNFLEMFFTLTEKSCCEMFSKV